MTNSLPHVFAKFCRVGRPAFCKATWGVNPPGNPVKILFVPCTDVQLLELQQLGALVGNGRQFGSQMVEWFENSFCLTAWFFMIFPKSPCLNSHKHEQVGLRPRCSLSIPLQYSSPVLVLSLSSHTTSISKMFSSRLEASNSAVTCTSWRWRRICHCWMRHCGASPGDTARSCGASSSARRTRPRCVAPTSREWRICRMKTLKDRWLRDSDGEIVFLLPALGFTFLIRFLSCGTL